MDNLFLNNFWFIDMINDLPQMSAEKIWNNFYHWIFQNDSPSKIVRLCQQFTIKQLMYYEKFESFAFDREWRWRLTNNFSSSEIHSQDKCMKKSSSQRVINQNVSKTIKKLKTVNRELSSLAMYDLSDHVSKQKRENRFSKLKTKSKDWDNKNEISSHIGNICSICRIDKFQNEKHFVELFNNRKSFSWMRQIAINKYLATSSNDSWKAVHQKWRSFV